MASRIAAVVRVRPLLPREVDISAEEAVSVWEDCRIRVIKDSVKLESDFDAVLAQDSSQQDVYEVAQGCVQAVLDGYNSAVLAYGATGSGKTFTMLGGYEQDLRDPQAAGLIPRALEALFGATTTAGEDGALNTRVTLSYLEIYNERVHDLLQPYKPNARLDPQDMRKRKAGLEVKDRGAAGTVVPGALAVKVRSVEQSLGLVRKGNQHRAVRHTEMNQHSSRSHTILQLLVEQRMPGGILRSKLNFVDLAGSERWGAHVEMSNLRVNELTSINQSLSTLVTVVAFLTEEGRAHIPYRDSKLTHLLQDSLGGNCNTMIIATVSPSTLAFEESCNTLKFADRARNIVNKVTVGLKTDLKQELELRNAEIRRLTDLLAKYAGLLKNGTMPGNMSRPGTGSASALVSADSGGLRAAMAPDAAALAATAASSAELNRLKAELLLAREDLAAERAARLKLQAAVASQAHAAARVARQEHLQHTADSAALGMAQLSSHQQPSAPAGPPGQQQLPRPPAPVLLPPEPSEDPAALQPPEPAPAASAQGSPAVRGWGRSSLMATAAQQQQQLLSTSMPGPLPRSPTSPWSSRDAAQQQLPASHSLTSLQTAFGEQHRRSALRSQPQWGGLTKPSSPLKQRAGFDSPAARALRSANLPNLDKGSMVFIMGARGTPVCHIKETAGQQAETLTQPHC